MNSNTLRQWLQRGDVEKLENLVLEGRGTRLLGETSLDLRARIFLKGVPSYLTKISQIHEATLRGSLTDVHRIIAEEPKKKLAISRDSSGVPLVHKSVYNDHPDITKWLVQNYPTAANQKDREGRTALHYCVACTKPGVVWDILIRGGTDASVCDKKGNPAAYYLAHSTEIELPAAEKVSVMKQSASKENLSFKPSNVRIWIHNRDIGKLQQVLWEGHGAKLRCETSNNPRVKKFLEAVPFIMGTIKDLHTAAVKNDVETFKQKSDDPVPGIIMRGKDNNGLNVLHKAAGLGHLSIAQDILSKYPETVVMQDAEGRTPLHYAAALKDDHIMYDLLVENGADEGIIDNKQKAAPFYKNRPMDVDVTNLSVIPDAPRVSGSYPKNWDWRILEGSESSSRGLKKAASNAEVDKAFGSCEITPDHVEGAADVSEDTCADENKDDLEEQLKIADDMMQANEVDRDDEAMTEATLQESTKEDETAGEQPENGAIQESEENDKMVSSEEGENKRVSRQGEETTDPGLKEDDGEGQQLRAKLDLADKPDEELGGEQDAEVALQDPEQDAEVAGQDPEQEEDQKQVQTQERDEKHEGHETEKEMDDEKERDEEMKGGEREEENEGKYEQGCEGNGRHEQEQGKKGEQEPVNDELEDKALDNEVVANNSVADDVENNNNEETNELEDDNALGDTTNQDDGTEASAGDSGVDDNIVQDDDQVIIGEHQEWPEAELNDSGMIVDPEVEDIVENGNMEQLAALVLNGEGRRLVGRHSSNPELQAFIDNVPAYMGKIHAVHMAAREGNLRDLQSALDRRKFATARDGSSPNGATPLHVAVIFGRTNVIRYLAGRFSETAHAVDRDGRTPLHYAATLADNGHYYSLLQHLGANPLVQDNFGHKAEYYKTNQEDFSHKKLLRDFGAQDNIAEEMLHDKDGSTPDIPIFRTEDGRYLASSLGDPLIKGLTEVANARPKDPVTYLATYLYNFASKNKPRPKTQESDVLIIPDRPVEGLEDHGGDAADEDPGYPQSPDSDTTDSALSNFNRDEHGQSLLHFAAARSHAQNGLFQFLQETKVNIGYRDELYRTARDVAQQAGIQENVEEIDRWVIYLAARGETEKLVELLLEGYDHILDVEDDGVKIVDATAQRGHESTIQFLQSIPNFVARRDEVHEAIRRGDVALVRNLLGNSNGGGRLLAVGKNSMGRCALHIATLGQHVEIVDFIVRSFPETLRIGDNLERTALHYAMGLMAVEDLSGILIKSGAKRVVKDLKARQPSYYFMNKSEIQRLQEEEEDMIN